MFLLDLPKKTLDKVLQYVKLKCKEQRQLCLENIEYGNPDLDEDMYLIRKSTVTDAPEPLLINIPQAII